MKQANCNKKAVGCWGLARVVRSE